MTERPEGLARRELFGMAFVDHASIDDLASGLASYRPRPATDLAHLPVVVTPNVDQVVHRQRGTSPGANRLTDAAEWVLPDGQPIVWASRLLGAPLTARLAGSSLVAALWPRLMAEGRPVLVVASSERVATRVRQDSDLACAVLAPMLSIEAPEDAPESIGSFASTCSDLIVRRGVSHVFVTLGFPKQDLLIAAIISQLTGRKAPVPLALGVGQSFEMYYGFVRRAPLWMQHLGLEWFFRFVQEPRRLFRRYFVTDPAFAGMVWHEWSVRRAARAL